MDFFRFRLKIEKALESWLGELGAKNARLSFRPVSTGSLQQDCASSFAVRCVQNCSSREFTNCVFEIMLRYSACKPLRNSHNQGPVKAYVASSEGQRNRVIGKRMLSTCGRKIAKCGYMAGYVSPGEHWQRVSCRCPTYQAWHIQPLQESHDHP